MAGEYLQEDIPRTSDIEFFSTLHGRERRAERGLTKRDLQAAIKYGKKERAHNDPKTGAPRWRYTWGDVVYITDETSTVEITSYLLDPVLQQLVDGDLGGQGRTPLAKLTARDLLDHEMAKDDVRRNPSLCTSHTVIVVDHSRSMRKADVEDHVNRIRASFTMLALDFVAKQMLTREATKTDVVSVMLMHDGVDVLFEREPMGRVLYNRFVDIERKVKPRSHGNYLPSLDLAEKLFRVDSNQRGTALGLLFLSDGRPSDNASGILRCGQETMQLAITNRVASLAAKFRQRLNVITVGFARTDQEFPVLDAMADAARRGGAKGQFHSPELSSAGLGSAIASAVSTLTDTKSHLSMTVMAPAAQARRRLPPIREIQKESAFCEQVEGWVVYAEGVVRWEYTPGSWMEKASWREVPLISSSADGVAIRKVPFGEGAERVVYKMQEVDSRRGTLVGELLVGKNSKWTSGPENDSSADIAAEIQAEASKIAKVFNSEIQQHLDNVSYEQNARVDRRVWKIGFLTCSIYRFMDGDVPKFIHAEKWLDPKSYTKWNGNNGYVFRGRGQSSLPLPSTFAQLAASEAHVDELMDGPAFLDGGDDIAFREGGDGDLAGEAVDYGTGAEDYIRSEAGGVGFGSRKRKRGYEQVVLDFRPSPTDYLQAFSHFSYVYSDRRVLVCDLQGVKSASSPDNPLCAGCFELTDPVIHYQSKTGRKRVYGRTDLGRKGMREFFRTHDCNDICRLLGLGTKSLPSKAFPQAVTAAPQAAAAAPEAMTGAQQAEMAAPQADTAAGTAAPQAMSAMAMAEAARVIAKAVVKARNATNKARKAAAKAKKAAAKAAKGAVNGTKATAKAKKQPQGQKQKRRKLNHG